MSRKSLIVGVIAAGVLALAAVSQASAPNDVPQPGSVSMMEMMAAHGMDMGDMMEMMQAHGMDVGEMMSGMTGSAGFGPMSDGSMMGGDGAPMFDHDSHHGGEG